jgi:hypothetical protein
MCALWRIRKGGKSANPRPSELLSKPAKLTVLSANTLDNRRNCRHNHMLDARSVLAFTRPFS